MKNLYGLYCIDLIINDVKTNSKEVKNKDLFVCVKGINEDRHKYIKEALEKGASGLIVSKGKNYSVPYVKVKNVNAELTSILNYVYSNAKKIKLIAVTGTDGKTTVASIVRNLLGNDLCGYIGTNGVLGQYIRSSLENTTPSIEVIYKYLNLFYDEGLKYASIETSSEGMLYKRTGDFCFDVAILTNFTEDHLNVHKTIKNYLNCKKKVFSKVSKNGVSILNSDDLYFKEFKKSCKSKIITYGKNVKSDLRILEYKLSSYGTKIYYLYDGKKYIIDSPLLGEFNVYNLSAAICLMLYYGYDFSSIRKKVFDIKIPLGRCEFLNYNTKYKICLDYAHTENGVKNILTFLNKIKNNRIITVMGAPGGREKEKRVGMGKNSQILSDLVIYTMDDPRFEDVFDIINDLIYDKVNNYLIVFDRSLAINLALKLAERNDIVAILGKGRDNYMAIGDKKIFYSDILVIDNYFKK